MFMWDCIKSEGLHLGTCSDRFLFGSCCYHNSTFNDIDIQRPNTTFNQNTSDPKPQAIVGSSVITISTSTPSSQTTPSATTTFLQSASSLSDHLNSMHISQKPQISIYPGNASNNQSSSNYQQQHLHHQHHHHHSHNQLSQASNDTNSNNHYSNSNKTPYNSYELNSNWPHEPSVLSSASENVIQQKPPNITSAQKPTTSTSLETTTTTLAPTLTQTLLNNQETSPTNIKIKPLIQQQQLHNQHQQQQNFQPIADQSDQAVALQSPMRVTTTPSPTATPQHVDLISSTQATQKPQSGSWLSRPATLLANAFFHSFKPFPYLSPNRQRPTYKPFVNYRPSHYKPMLAQQRPSLSLNNGQQQVPVTQGGELIGSTSENVFSNLFNTTSTLPSPITNNSSSQDNSDHHIVNPSSSSSSSPAPSASVTSSMTDRQRPFDSNHYNNVNDDLNQKQTHYELVNTTSFNGNQLNSSSVHNNQNEATYTNTIQFNNPSSIVTDSIAQTMTTIPSNISGSQTSVAPVIGDNTTSANNNINNDNNNEAGLVTSTYSNFEQSKPVVLLEPSHNESVNYPSYPLISSFTLPTIQQQEPPIENHYPTLSQIGEIPGLSENSFNPTKENFTLTNSISSTEEYSQQQGQSSYEGSGILSIDDQVQKPSQIGSSQGPGIQTTTTFLPILTSAIGNSNAPTPTTSISFASTSPVNPTMVQDLVSSTQPSSSTTQLKPFNPLLGGDGGVKKGSSVNKEAACGVTSLYPQTKVVGGKNAAFGAWPWQVSVRKVSFFGFSSTHRCGGAVISSEWIATAGHCVEDLALQSIRIRVGEYDFSSMSEPFPYIERAARRKVVHPKYNFYTYENDLALVQLDQPIQFPPHVAPICLPPDNIDLLGRNATVTGWGRLNEGGTLPAILQEVRVPIVSNDKCKDMFLSAGRPEYIPDIFLCAGYEEGGRDSCQGDSGGPLQVKGDDGKWFLAGIISWGIGCAEQNLPGVCTRISRFKLWIQSTMNSSS